MYVLSQHTSSIRKNSILISPPQQRDKFGRISWPWDFCMWSKIVGTSTLHLKFKILTIKPRRSCLDMKVWFILSLNRRIIILHISPSSFSFSLHNLFLFCAETLRSEIWVFNVLHLALYVTLNFCRQFISTHRARDFDCSAFMDILGAKDKRRKWVFTFMPNVSFCVNKRENNVILHVLLNF